MVSRRAHWHILYGRPSKAIGIDASAVCVRKGFGSAGRRRDRRPASPALQPSYRDVEDLLIERGGHPPARRNCGRLRTTRRSCAAGRSTRILERRSDTRGNGVPHRLPATGRHVAIVSNKQRRRNPRLSTSYRPRSPRRPRGGPEHCREDEARPGPLLTAAEALSAPLPRCVLIGDSTWDIDAAHQIDVPAIGYANKPA